MVVCCPAPSLREVEERRRRVEHEAEVARLRAKEVAEQVARAEADAARRQRAEEKAKQEEAAARRRAQKAAEEAANVAEVAARLRAKAAAEEAAREAAKEAAADVEKRAAERRRLEVEQEAARAEEEAARLRAKQLQEEAQEAEAKRKAAEAELEAKRPRRDEATLGVISVSVEDDLDMSAISEESLQNDVGEATAAVRAAQEPGGGAWRVCSGASFLVTFSGSLATAPVPSLNVDAAPPPKWQRGFEPRARYCIVLYCMMHAQFQEGVTAAEKVICMPW